MEECERALILDLSWIDQSEEITSFDFGASSARLKGMAAQKQAAGDLTLWIHRSRHAHSHDKES
jgi:hypothetical protein